MVDQLLYYTNILSKGLPITLSLSFSAIVTSCIFAIGMTILLTTKNKMMLCIIKNYIIIFTGTPFLVQLFLIYYGTAQLLNGLQQWSVLWNTVSSPWFCCFIALSLNSTAYTTQLFYGTLKASPQGLWQACAALGINRNQALKIMIPYALKRALSSYSNEVIFIVKSTALASTITLMDIMGYNQLLNGEYYDFSIFIITGAVYLLINGLLSLLIKMIERKALRFESSQ